MRLLRSLGRWESPLAEERRDLILTANPQVAGTWGKHDLAVMDYISLGCSWARAPCMLSLVLSHSLSLSHTQMSSGPQPRQQGQLCLQQLSPLPISLTNLGK